MTEKIRVIVVDDHTLVRAGLVRLLNDSDTLDIVGEAGSCQESITVVEKTRPDVILMDITMPGEDGIVATRKIKERFPRVAVIIMSMHGENKYVVDAIRAGASGYLRKDAAAEDVVASIHSVIQGGVVISPPLARRILSDINGLGRTTGARERAWDELTDRELEVLALIADGMTNRAIARRIHLSENTIKRHTSNIFRKLQVDRRGGAAAEAVRRGLIPPSSTG